MLVLNENKISLLLINSNTDAVPNIPPEGRTGGPNGLALLCHCWVSVIFPRLSPHLNLHYNFLSSFLTFLDILAITPKR